jgi:hypothetical protein
MDPFLDWLDTGLVGLRHAWGWAGVTLTLATLTIVGIAAVARRYGHPDSPRHG